MSVSGTNINMGNPLDLNNFPDDFTRDNGKQTLEDDDYDDDVDGDDGSSSSASGVYKKKKNGEKDESEKVYECRFCSLKFCKSQALGGHMNRHRQERETEALNHARQLVFSNDNLLPTLARQLGGQPMIHGGFHHQAVCNMASTSVYPTKLFSDTSTTVLSPAPPQPPQQAAHMYTSPASRLNNNPYSHQMNDYFVGHVCTGNPPPFSLQNFNAVAAPPPDSATNYTCIGAPVGQSFTLAEGSGGGGGGGGGREM